jgi:thermostable 8-oxoguanine DNA glycosylase
MPITVDPKKITNFDRSKEELELFYLFCILVAGKNADWASLKLTDLFKNKPKYQTPFEFLKTHLVDLNNILVANKVGQYRRIQKAIEQSLELDLKTATLDEFLNVFGVGPKTARFFILHTRNDAECAVLDTHILKWLRTIVGDSIDIPQSTPPLKEYLQLERLAIRMMRVHFEGLSLAEADLMIWISQSGRLSE